MSKNRPGEKTVSGVFDNIFDQTDFVNAAGVASVVELPLDTVSANPDQPRKHFGSEELSQLTASIAAHGVLQPIVVRDMAMGRYQIVVGERRFRAARQAGFETIPAIVRSFDDQSTQLLALVENLQRTDLNPLEETDALLELLATVLEKPVPDVAETLTALGNEDRGRVRHSAVATEERTSIERIFSELGRFSVRSFVTHRLPLLNLPEDVLSYVRQGQLDYTKATAVSRIKDGQQRADLISEILTNNLSLREVQQRVVNKTTQMTSVDDGKALSHQYASLGKRLRKSPALKDEKKVQRIQKLLTQLEKLLD